MKNKNKNRKLILLFLLLIIVVIIFGIYYLFNNEKILNKELSGEKIMDGVYFYDLGISEYTHDIDIIDGNIYYSVELDDKIEVYKLDIYTNKKEKLGEFDKENGYCYIDEYIYYSNYDNMLIYNNKFKKIYEGKIASIIPYKDSYLEFKNNTLFYKDKEYIKFEKDLTKYSIYQYQIFDDNVYIYFGDYEGDRLLYNLSENKFETYVSQYDIIKKHSNGLYFWNDDQINVISLNSKEIKKYNNPISYNVFETNLLDNNLLYYFADDYFRIYNLENENVSLFDYRINKRVDDIDINNNLVYLTNNDEVYILKLDEISLKEMTINELETEFENKITNRINNIYNTYDVDIKIKEEADLNFEVFKESTEGQRDFKYLNNMLDSVEEVFSTFGKEFFKEFIHDDYTGLRIYLVDTININTNFSAAGLELKYYDKYSIITDESHTTRTLYHELMHALEDAVTTKGNYIFDKWEDYNPKGYSYLEMYNQYDLPYKYSIGNSEDDIYFVDNYSQSDELEDRALIFENICMNKYSIIKDNPYLLKKAKYQIDEIKKYYPMLEDNEIFNIF